MKLEYLIDQALRLFKRKVLTPEMVSLTNFPSQTTLLLPGPDMPRFQHFDNSMANATTSNNENLTIGMNAQLMNADLGVDIKRHLDQPPNIEMPAESKRAPVNRP